VSDCPSKSKVCGEKCYSPQIGESPLPLPRGLGGTSAAPTGASVAPAGTSSDGPAAGGSASASGTNSTAALSARGDGARVPTCRRWSTPHHFPPRPTTSSPAPAEGKALAVRADGTPHCVVLGAPAT
jgi:hypothetical protein